MVFEKYEGKRPALTNTSSEATWRGIVSVSPKDYGDCAEEHGEMLRHSPFRMALEEYKRKGPALINTSSYPQLSLSTQHPYKHHLTPRKSTT
jgi:hypothetical protein